MGIGTKIASFIAGGESAKQALKIVENVGDSIVFTNEEKSQAWLEAQKIIATQNSPTSISRRYIAWAIVLQILLLVNISVVCILLGFEQQKDDMFMLAKDYWIGEAFLGVIVFYFGPHLTRRKNAAPIDQ